MTATAEKKTYIGDGVYAEDDGIGVWLTTERSNGTHMIYLEGLMLVVLLAWLRAWRAAPPAPVAPVTHTTVLVEPEVGKPPRSYWWTCSCGDEGGPHEAYEQAWNAMVDHERAAKGAA